MSNELFLDGHKLVYHLNTIEDWLKGKDISPIHVEISPTSSCNQRCIFCYRDFDGHKAKTLSEEVFIDLIKSMAEVGVKSCLIAGDGEPLLNKATPDAVVLGHKLGIDMALNSNAVLLTDEIIKKVLPALTWLRLSIMSADEETYKKIHGVKKDDLSVAINNIEKCVTEKKKRNLKVTIGIQQVLLPENAGQIYQEAKLAKDIGVDYYVLKPFSKHNENAYNSSENLSEKYRQDLERAENLSDKNFTSIIRWNTFRDKGKREYHKCYGIPFIAQIGADGGFYSCCPFFYVERFSFGNLYKESFKKILAGQRRKKVIEDIVNNLDVHKECMTYCRHHQINKFLWDLKNVPEHVNFI